MIIVLPSVNGQMVRCFHASSRETALRPGPTIALSNAIQINLAFKYMSKEKRRSIAKNWSVQKVWKMYWWLQAQCTELGACKFPWGLALCQMATGPWSSQTEGPLSILWVRSYSLASARIRGGKVWGQVLSCWGQVWQLTISNSRAVTPIAQTSSNVQSCAGPLMSSVLCFQANNKHGSSRTIPIYFPSQTLTSTLAS